MARLSKSRFRRLANSYGDLHKEVWKACWHVFRDRGRPFLQLDTYGTIDRVCPRIPTQKFQIDSELAQKLMEIFEAEGFLELQQENLDVTGSGLEQDEERARRTHYIRPAAEQPAAPPRHSATDPLVSMLCAHDEVPDEVRAMPRETLRKWRDQKGTSLLELAAAKGRLRWIPFLCRECGLGRPEAGEVVPGLLREALLATRKRYQPLARYELLKEFPHLIPADASASVVTRWLSIYLEEDGTPDNEALDSMIARGADLPAAVAAVCWSENGRPLQNILVQLLEERYGIVIPTPEDERAVEPGEEEDAEAASEPQWVGHSAVWRCDARSHQLRLYCKWQREQVGDNCLYIDDADGNPQCFMSQGGGENFHVLSIHFHELLERGIEPSCLGVRVSETPDSRKQGSFLLQHGAKGGCFIFRSDRRAERADAYELLKDDARAPRRLLVVHQDAVPVHPELRLHGCPSCVDGALSRTEQETHEIADGWVAEEYEVDYKDIPFEQLDLLIGGGGNSQLWGHILPDADALGVDDVDTVWKFLGNNPIIVGAAPRLHHIALSTPVRVVGANWLDVNLVASGEAAELWLNGGRNSPEHPLELEILSKRLLWLPEGWKQARQLARTDAEELRKSAQSGRALWEYRAEFKGRAQTLILSSPLEEELWFYRQNGILHLLERPIHLSPGEESSLPNLHVYGYAPGGEGGPIKLMVKGELRGTLSPEWDGADVERVLCDSRLLIPGEPFAVHTASGRELLSGLFRPSATPLLYWHEGGLKLYAPLEKLEEASLRIRNVCGEVEMTVSLDELGDEDELEAFDLSAALEEQELPDGYYCLDIVESDTLVHPLSAEAWWTCGRPALQPDDLCCMDEAYYRFAPQELREAVAAARRALTKEMREAAKARRRAVASRRERRTAAAGKAEGAQKASTAKAENGKRNGEGAASDVSGKRVLHSLDSLPDGWAGAEPQVRRMGKPQPDNREDAVSAWWEKRKIVEQVRESRLPFKAELLAAIQDQWEKGFSWQWDGMEMSTPRYVNDDSDRLVINFRLFSYPISRLDLLSRRLRRSHALGNFFRRDDYGDIYFVLGEQEELVYRNRQWS